MGDLTCQARNAILSGCGNFVILGISAHLYEIRGDHSSDSGGD
jgi:hypothetical protein